LFEPVKGDFHFKNIETFCYNLQSQLVIEAI
jgi:hypothetical protein